MRTSSMDRTNPENDAGGGICKALQCEKHGKEACMECHSCRQALGHNQPDIIYVNHDKPNTISVDDIRTQVNNDIDVKPYSSSHKIYIIDEAEKMNQQAQNALAENHRRSRRHMRSSCF